MSRRRRGPTPKKGSNRAAGVHVRQVDGVQLESLLAAFDQEDGDDCAVCRAMGIEVHEDGTITDR